ncbi:hypothetical protein GGR56DRAFT_678658 [Xylariaceae sp. FL0804]|nr:hypothetical protein GGR56DRAFT_678658 [Xylariaceae sp. FL0804]
MPSVASTATSPKAAVAPMAPAANPSKAGVTRSQRSSANNAHPPPEPEEFIDELGRHLKTLIAAKANIPAREVREAKAQFNRLCNDISHAFTNAWRRRISEPEKLPEPFPLFLLHHLGREPLVSEFARLRLTECGDQRQRLQPSPWTLPRLERLAPSAGLSSYWMLVLYFGPFILSSRNAIRTILHFCAYARSHGEGNSRAQRLETFHQLYRCAKAHAEKRGYRNPRIPNVKVKQFSGLVHEANKDGLQFKVQDIEDAAKEIYPGMANTNSVLEDNENDERNETNEHDENDGHDEDDELDGNDEHYENVDGHQEENGDETGNKEPSAEIAADQAKASSSESAEDEILPASDQHDNDDSPGRALRLADQQSQVDTSTIEVGRGQDSGAGLELRDISGGLFNNRRDSVFGDSPAASSGAAELIEQRDETNRSSVDPPHWSGPGPESHAEDSGFQLDPLDPPPTSSPDASPRNHQAGSSNLLAQASNRSRPPAQTTPTRLTVMNQATSSVAVPRAGIQNQKATPDVIDINDRNDYDDDTRAGASALGRQPLLLGPSALLSDLASLSAGSWVCDHAITALLSFVTVLSNRKDPDHRTECVPSITTSSENNRRLGSDRGTACIWDSLEGGGSDTQAKTQVTRVLRWIRGVTDKDDDDGESPVTEWSHAANPTLQTNSDDCGVLVVAHAARACSKEIDVGHTQFDPASLRQLFSAQLLFPRLDVLGRAGFAYNTRQSMEPMPEPSPQALALLKPLQDDYEGEQDRLAHAMDSLRDLCVAYTRCLNARRLAPLQAVLLALADCRDLDGSRGSSSSALLRQSHYARGLDVLSDLSRQSRAVLASQRAICRWLNHDTAVVDALFSAAAARYLRSIDKACTLLRDFRSRIDRVESVAASLRQDIEQRAQRDTEYPPQRHVEQRTSKRRRIL